MNDRFQFRAYDKEKKVMIYDMFDPKNRWDELYDLKLGTDLHRFVRCIGLSQGTYMQSTGLRDRNGKLIFEYDKIKTPAGIGIVKFDKCYRLFWYNLNDIENSTTLHDCKENDLEVVGNYFENPELIEDKA